MYFKSPLSAVLVLAQAILILSLLAAGPVYPQSLSAFLLITLGLILGSWGTWTLSTAGKFNIFPDVTKEAKLVTVGPYKYIRHPLYTAILIFSLGLFLNNFSVMRAFLLLLLLLLFLYKMRLEEYYLSQLFSGFKSYASKTSRLIPLIY